MRQIHDLSTIPALVNNIIFCHSSRVLLPYLASYLYASTSQGLNPNLKQCTHNLQRDCNIEERKHHKI